MKKKSYNPFKMAGTYIGILIAMLIFFSMVSIESEFFLVDKGSSCNPQNPPTHFQEGDNQAKYIASQQIGMNCIYTSHDNSHSWYNYYGTCNCHFFQNPLTLLIFYPFQFLLKIFIYGLLGFIFGFGIHSLIRRFRR